MNKRTKRNIKSIAAIICFFTGICLGLFVGIFVMFVGGIVNIVDQIKAAEDSFMIVWGVVKIVFSAPVGWIIFFILAKIASKINE